MRSLYPELCIFIGGTVTNMWICIFHFGDQKQAVPKFPLFCTHQKQENNVQTALFFLATICSLLLAPLETRTRSEVSQILSCDRTFEIIQFSTGFFQPLANRYPTLKNPSSWGDQEVLNKLINPWFSSHTSGCSVLLGKLCGFFHTCSLIGLWSWMSGWKLVTS